MIEFLSSNESLQNLGSKEYLNYPSLILREVKGCKLLSAGAKHCWELLYDLSKFDAKRFIDISIKKIKSILSDSKSYRTIQRYLAQLAEHDFITIKKNFDSYGRIENTYSIKVPTFITNKLNESTTKVFIKSNNLVSNPVNPGYDSFVQGNKELNIINNNCYPLEKDEKEEFNEELFSNSISNEINSDIEVLEYYPAKEKPSTPSKAVLRHALKGVVRFEALITSKLTTSQEAVIKQIIAFWTTMRYISSPKECFDWIQSVLLNPKALSQCKNNFLQKTNVIFKMIREKKFSKPFKERYKQNQELDMASTSLCNKDALSNDPVSSFLKVISSSEKLHFTKRSFQESEKFRKIHDYQKQIAVAIQKLKSTDDVLAKHSFNEFILMLRARIQELQCD